MSRLLVRKVVVASLLGFFVGAGLMASRSGSFSAASLSKERSTASSSFDKRMPMGKPLAVIQVSLQTPEGIPNNESQEATLVGWVRLNQDFPGEVHYRWELPEGVSVVEGQASDVLPEIKSGETAEVRLIVRGFSKESLKIVALHGFINSSEGEFGNSAVLTSRPEDSYEMLSSAPKVSTGFAKSESIADAQPVRPLLDGPIQR